MLKPVKVIHKLLIYSNLGLTIKEVQIYVKIWTLQILVLPNLYFENMYKIVTKKII